MLGNFRMTSDSFVKIRRAIDLHSSCINERSAGNTLINLWIGLESLVPKADKINKVDSIMSAITPFVGFYYYKKNAKYISSWLEKVDLTFMEIAYAGDETLSVLDRWEALIAVASTNDFEGVWMSLIENYKNYPLVIYRLKQFRSKTRKGSDALKGVNSHVRRVDWHLRRIYRKRNILVHLGADDASTNLLVENIHEYFDLFIDGIVEIISKHEAVMSLDNIIRHASIRWKSHISALAEKKDQFTSSNYRQHLIPEM